MPKIPVVGIDANKRRLITPQNLAELAITPALVQEILASDALKIPVVRDGAYVQVSPDGLSINETTFGSFTGPTAAELGWMSYFDVGAALIEERADIIQPPADVLAAREYQNRAAAAVRSFSDTIEFAVSNTLSWELGAQAQLTLQGSVTGSLSAQLQKSIANSLAQMTSSTSSSRNATTNTTHSHPNNTGSQTDQTSETSGSNTNSTTVTDTTTLTATGTATGSATGLASLMLGINGSVSGSVTTSFRASSTVSGDIQPNTSISTQATQRRQVRSFIYELPVNFAGYVALHYPSDVPVQESPPQSLSPANTRVIARSISRLNLAGQSYRPKGVAELVSTLSAEHVVFDGKAIPSQDQAFSTVRPHHL